MIRKVNATDAQAIAHIYNHYVLNTTISFETQAVTTAHMLHRITSISAQYPYLVYEHESAWPLARRVKPPSICTPIIVIGA